MENYNSINVEYSYTNSWNIAHLLSVEREESTKKPNSAELGFLDKHKTMIYMK